MNLSRQGDKSEKRDAVGKENRARIERLKIRSRGAEKKRKKGSVLTTDIRQVACLLENVKSED
jgi:hypothetical protein